MGEALRAQGIASTGLSAPKAKGCTLETETCFASHTRSKMLRQSTQPCKQAGENRVAAVVSCTCLHEERAMPRLRSTSPIRQAPWYYKRLSVGSSWAAVP